MAAQPTQSQQDDSLLPASVPRRLGLISAALLLAILVGMIVAGIAGGVNWLIAIGGAGTALGTLGLAYFTFTVAERTNALADSSQRLETAATQELLAGRNQAAAAIAAAREAQRTRLDAIAPIVDFGVEFLGAWMSDRGRVPTSGGTQMYRDRHSGNPEALSFTGVLGIRFTNYGRTPAFARIKHFGAAFDRHTLEIRIEPDGAQEFGANVEYIGLPQEDPFAAREVCYEIEVQGAMTRNATDTIIWVGELTLLRRDPPGFRLNDDPLQIKRYEVNREYIDPELPGS